MDHTLHLSNTFYLGWGSLALINAVLAQGKNRRGLIWFLLSLVLGPVATLILALMKKLPSAQSDGSA